MQRNPLEFKESLLKISGVEDARALDEGRVLDLIGDFAAVKGDQVPPADPSVSSVKYASLDDDQPTEKTFPPVAEVTLELYDEENKEFTSLPADYRQIGKNAKNAPAPLAQLDGIEGWQKDLAQSYGQYNRSLECITLLEGERNTRFRARLISHIFLLLTLAISIYETVSSEKQQADSGVYNYDYDEIGWIFGMVLSFLGECFMLAYERLDPNCLSRSDHMKKHCFDNLLFPSVYRFSAEDLTRLYKLSENILVYKDDEKDARGEIFDIDKKTNQVSVPGYITHSFKEVLKVIEKKRDALRSDMKAKAKEINEKLTTVDYLNTILPFGRSTLPVVLISQCLFKKPLIEKKKEEVSPRSLAINDDAIMQVKSEGLKY